jgi:membrane protein YdbS with pleckstrin-like domain
VQSVLLAETPFDRRWGMRRLRIDTAGQGRAGHQLALAYLSNDVAQSLYRAIRAAAAVTELRW